MPGADDVKGTEDDIVILPVTPGNDVADDKFGYVTVTDDVIVADSNELPILGSDDMGVPNGSVVIPEGIIILPGDTNPVVDQNNGSVTIPPNGSNNYMGTMW